MPKKHHYNPYRKPPSTVHGSLTPAEISHTPEPAPPATVNERLASLRIGQQVRNAEGKEKIIELATAKTVHPSVKALLNIADTPPPRPRRGLPIRPYRGPPVAGPPTPPSWLIRSIHGSTPRDRKPNSSGKSRLNSRARPHVLNHFPSPVAELPKPGTLLYLTFKALATNWLWHVEYDQYYLATLPPFQKSLLLSFIAIYGPDEGVTPLGLQRLFTPSDQVDNASGADEMTHLDLSGSLGRSINPKYLQLWFKRTPAALSMPPDVGTPSDSGEGVSESWEDAEAKSPSEPVDSFPEQSQSPALSRPPTLIFSNVTQLSISHPPPTISWLSLLSLAKHLGTITHLSLAYWPIPTLTPNSIFSQVSTPTGRTRYGGRDIYSQSLDDDWNEAASILRRLSKSTYCLQYLDLTGCSWWSALAWQNPPILTSRERINRNLRGLGEDILEVETGPDWSGAWRHLAKLILREGADGDGDALVKKIKVARAAKKTKGKVVWLDIVTDVSSRQRSFMV